MKSRLLPVLSILLGATALSACSINPRFDVPYDAKGVPSVKDILDKMYCELMHTADEIDPAYRAAFLKEDMTTTITLIVVGQDSTSPTLNFPAIGSILLAVTGVASRQRTNTMTLTYDFPVQQLHDVWEKHDGRVTVNCDAEDAKLGGDFNIERVVAAGYGSGDDAGFALPQTATTATDGTFTGESDFVITRSLNPTKLTFTISPIIGPNTLNFSDTYTNKIQYTFNPEKVPKPQGPAAVYLVPCPPHVTCLEGLAPFLSVPKNGGPPPTQTPPPAATPEVRQLNPDAIEQLNRLNLLALPGTTPSL